MITFQFIKMRQEELKAYITTWVSHFSGSDDLSLNAFWISYFEELLCKESFKILKEVKPDDTEIVDKNTRILLVPKSLFQRVYKDKVYELLEKNKNEKDPAKLVKLSMKLKN